VTSLSSIGTSRSLRVTHPVQAALGSRRSNGLRLGPMEPRSRQGLSRYIAAFVAMNIVFAAMGLLWRHPAGVVGWWVTWIVADVAALSATAMAAAGRPLRLTWDRMFAWAFISVNVGAIISLVAVTVAAARCDPTAGPPEACGISFLLVLIPLGSLVADLALGAIWGVGRVVRRAVRAE
jgi:hypothetical protein